MKEGVESINCNQSLTPEEIKIFLLSQCLYQYTLTIVLHFYSTLLPHIPR